MANIQLHPVARRKQQTAAATQERTKGEAVEPVAVIQLINKVGVTAAHRLLGVSTTTLHKARKPGAVVSKVIELASEAQLRLIQAQDSQDATMEAARHATPHGAHAPAPVAAHPHGATRLIIIEVPEDKADNLERIARAWGAEFTKA